MKVPDQEITRRDFLKGSLIGSGAMLLNMPAPLVAAGESTDIYGWNGYAGVGDYARANGNTESVRDAAHLIREGNIEALLPQVMDTGEIHDSVVIGGGFAGLAAARTLLSEGRQDHRCLLLENHALPGGEARRNEFLVDGHLISGPQGSNLVSVPTGAGDWYDELWKALRIPRDPAFMELTGHQGHLRISRANYLPMFGIAEQTASAGYFFDRQTFGVEPYWDIDSSRNHYANTAFTAAEKADLKRLREGTGRNLAGENWETWLDSITYAHYLEQVLQVQPRISKVMDEVVATTGGLGCDAVSALFAMKAGLAGFDRGFGSGSIYRINPADTEAAGLYSFPGGNDAVFRLLLKSVLPEAIKGGDSFAEVHDGRYRFDRFDQPSTRLRIRLDAMAVRVAHDGTPSAADGVAVIYHCAGKLYRVRAKGVVSAAGGWVNKHIIQDLPLGHAEACAGMVHGSNMIINVALRNWRFMARLGISAAHYFNGNGLGAFCNIRRPMVLGRNQAPLDPAKPVVLTFYIGFPQRGLPAAEQAKKSRWELLSKSYADIEHGLRRQMNEMFAMAGFDDRRDIAGIVVNRWGHSYVVPTPGFFHGRDGRPAPRDVLEKPVGRIAFGHSELNGVQEWFGAVEHGERAARQVLEVM